MNCIASGFSCLRHERPIQECYDEATRPSTPRPWVHAPPPPPPPQPEPTADAVEHPAHYTFGKFEVIDVIEDWSLGFHLGNAVKYIARAGRKGDRVEDLKKARFYLDREIKRSEGAK